MISEPEINRYIDCSAPTGLCLNAELRHGDAMPYYLQCLRPNYKQFLSSICEARSIRQRLKKVRWVTSTHTHLLNQMQAPINPPRRGLRV